MTDPKNIEQRNIEALKALIFFILILFVIAGSLDLGYLNAKKYNMIKGLEIAAWAGVQGLPDVNAARHLTLNVANSQGLALKPSEIKIDPKGQWIQIDKRDYYETVFLYHVGINRIAFHAHVFGF